MVSFLSATHETDRDIGKGARHLIEAARKVLERAAVCGLQVRLRRLSTATAQTALRVILSASRSSRNHAPRRPFARAQLNRCAQERKGRRGAMGSAIASVRKSGCCTNYPASRIGTRASQSQKSYIFRPSSQPGVVAPHRGHQEQCWFHNSPARTTASLVIAATRLPPTRRFRLLFRSVESIMVSHDTEQCPRPSTLSA